MRWTSLAVWIAVCLGAGALGGRWTAPEIPAWYRGLRKPSFNPPNWIFAPVWTTLYVFMGVAAWRIAQSPDPAKRGWALGLFMTQLALNLGWSWLFFRRHSIGAALGEVVVLWVAIGATIAVFAQTSRTAAWLLAPYWAWVSFASVLNVAIWRLNRGEHGKPPPSFRSPSVKSRKPGNGPNASKSHFGNLG